MDGEECDEDSIELAEQARKDQGRHEMEVCFGNEEADLHHHLTVCGKNPGHHGFIPVRKFTIDHLPSIWKHPFVYESIRFLSQVTVRLAVRGTSFARPFNYPFSRYTGKRVTRFGSGLAYVHVGDVNIASPCSMPNCDQPDRHDEFGQIIITTAAHVVFDESEAKNTTVEFFFDDESDKASVVKARGVGVLNVDLNVDRTLIACVTHDQALIGRLVKLTKSFIELRAQWKEEDFRDIDLRQLAAVSSHPHGKSKQISIGRLRQTLNVAACYDAATCPGSSGAPVLKFVHKPANGFPMSSLFYGHSGCDEFGSGCNQASPGLPSYFP